MTVEDRLPCPEVTDLTACLEEIIALCDDFCSVLRRERSSLTAGKDGDLAVALTEKRDRLARLHSLEEKRRDLSRRVAGALGLGPSEKSLADLALRLNEADRLGLVNLKDRLCRVIKEVGALNQGNAGLIRRAQHYNRHMMGLLSGHDEGVYGPDGAPPTEVGTLIQRRA